MGHIGLDGTKKGLFRAAVEEDRSDLFFAAQDGGEYAMYSVYHLHGASVDDNRRKRASGFCQANDMFLIVPFETRRFP